MSWRFGEIDRTKVHRTIRHFAPNRTANRVHDVDLHALWATGKRLLLLDVDHTLVHWKAENFDEEVIKWINEAKRIGFKICIISNTRHPERLGRIASRLEIDKLRGRFKPSRTMYLQALSQFGMSASQAIMIGDQIMTDILGANRSGIDSILLKPLSNKEFLGTKVNRGIESLVKPFLFRMVSVTDSPTNVQPDSAESGPTLKQQIVRFAVVGGTSFVIDFALTYLFMNVIHVGDQRLSESFGSWLMQSFPSLTQYANSPVKAAAPYLGGLASFIAMFNSFVLNRKWTFRAEGRARTVTQLHRFYTVSISGAVLNALIFGGFYNIIPAHATVSLLLAKVIAAGVVAVWNFTGQRYYAFRQPKEAA